MSPHLPTSGDVPFVFDPETSSGRVLTAIYAMQDAEALFRSRLRKKLRIGASELATVQFLSRRETIGANDRPMDVAAHLGVTTSAASIIITRLFDRGYVTRRVNPADGRGQYIRLTDTVHAAVLSASGNGELGALAQVTTLSDRESRRMVRLLTGVTTGFADGAAS